MMYTYEYERVYVEGFFQREAKGHKEVIARRAENGWRYVGVIPVVWTNGDTLAEMDLVFEKQTDYSQSETTSASPAGPT